MIRKRVFSALAMAMCMLLVLAGTLLATSPTYPDVVGVFDGKTRIRLAGHDGLRTGDTISNITLNITSQYDDLLVSNNVTPHAAGGSLILEVSGNLTKVLDVYGLLGPVGRRIIMTLWSVDSLDDGNLHAASLYGYVRMNRGRTEVTQFRGRVMLMICEDPPTTQHMYGFRGIRLSFTPAA